MNTEKKKERKKKKGYKIKTDPLVAQLPWETAHCIKLHVDAEASRARFKYDRGRGCADARKNNDIHKRVKSIALAIVVECVCCCV